ncbi:MAG: hypothetical protein IJT73_03020, partial [Selenomonadaceae bacterium]|nr:hypothetical protein [Selenomonadaceae bacterium]
ADKDNSLCQSIKTTPEYLMWLNDTLNPTNTKEKNELLKDFNSFDTVYLELETDNQKTWVQSVTAVCEFSKTLNEKAVIKPAECRNQEIKL